MQPPLLPRSLEETPSEPPTPHQLHEYRAMVKDRLHDAMESTIFMCGMAALDFDYPCYDILLCDPSLECDTIVEPEFYVSRIQSRRMGLCCHCAGTLPDSPIEMNSHLKAPEGPYSVVLPICKACMDSGCHIIVRNARQNATAKQAKLDAKHAREVARQENAVVENASNGVVEDASNVVVDVAPPNPRRRSRRNTRASSPRYRYILFIRCFHSNYATNYAVRRRSSEANARTQMPLL